jgi:hypothetical protein
MPPDYYFTDPSGQTRPGHNPKGRGGGLLVAIGLAVALGASGTGAAMSIGASGASSSSVSRTQPKTQAKARGKRASDIVKQLQRARLHARLKDSDASSDCAANSYGQVREFFREHRCDALVRALIEVRDGRAVALVAVAVVDMPDEQVAIALKRLVDVHGTGTITELAGKRFTGRFYASRREDTTVVNAQAEPVGRAAAAVALAELAARTLR